MAYIYEGSVTGSCAGGSPDSCTTGNIDMSACDLLIAAVGSLASGSGGGTPAMSDSCGNIWSTLLSQLAVSGTITIFYVFSPTVTSAQNFTVSGGSLYAGMVVAGFRAGAASTLDQQHGAGGMSGTNEPGPITPTYDNELIVSGLLNTDTADASIDSSYSIANQVDLVAGQAFGAALGYLIQTSAATTDPTWTTSGPQSAGALASFFATSPPPPPPPPEVGGGLLLRGVGV